MVKGDSLLIIRQVQGVWKVQKDSLRPLLQQVIQLPRWFVECQFRHIPRDKNAMAHELESKIVAQEVRVHVINMPSYKGRENLEEEEFVLRTGRARKELSYHRRLAVTRCAQRYVIIHDDLYLKDVDSVFRKLVRLRYQDGSSMAEHMNAFQGLIHQTTALKVPLADEVLALFLLGSLPETWETLVP